jgi:plastocyanin
MLRKILFLASIFVLALATVGLCAVGVSVEDDFYTQANITVSKGTMVVWTWNGRNSHSVTSGPANAPDGLFDSGIKSSGTFSFTFNNVGTFPYFCRVHGAMMTGTVTVSCSNKSQLLKNPGFESGTMNWVSSPSGIINSTTTFPPHSGRFKAQLNGKGSTNTASINQRITIPAGACSASLSFFLRVASTETASTANDKLKVQILSDAGAVLKTLKVYSNLNKSNTYSKKSLNILAFKGQTIRVRFLGTENSSLKTTFLVDDTAVNIAQ